MNKLKVLSPLSSFGFMKYDFVEKRVVEINNNFKKFLEEIDLSPGDLVSEIKRSAVKDAAHVNISGTEFLINIEYNHTVITLSAHQISSLVKGQKQTPSLPMDELHKRRLLTLGEMTAGIIHDINNPLNIVNSGTELLSFFIEDLEGEVDSSKLGLVKDQVAKIKAGAQRINEVSEGVRMLMHKNQIDFKQQDLIKIITSSSACCVSFLRENGIEFSLKTKDLKNPIVSCKESLLAQVFINLIKNSNDAIKNLAPHNKYIEFEVSETVTHLMVKVKDGGKGIPQEIKEKIFEPFFTTKNMGEGTGIGLSLCQQILEAHGGWLKLDESSSNTTFILAISKNLKS